jgi:hypothetical protein
MFFSRCSFHALSNKESPAACTSSVGVVVVVAIILFRLRPRTLSSSSTPTPSFTKLQTAKVLLDAGAEVERKCFTTTEKKEVNIIMVRRSRRRVGPKIVAQTTRNIDTLSHFVRPRPYLSRIKEASCSICELDSRECVYSTMGKWPRQLGLVFTTSLRALSPRRQTVPFGQLINKKAPPPPKRKISFFDNEGCADSFMVGEKRGRRSQLHKKKKNRGRETAGALGVPIQTKQAR